MYLRNAVVRIGTLVILALLASACGVNDEPAFTETTDGMIAFLTDLGW